MVPTPPEVLPEIAPAAETVGLLGWKPRLVPAPEAEAVPDEGEDGGDGFETSGASGGGATSGGVQFGRVPFLVVGSAAFLGCSDRAKLAYFGLCSHVCRRDSWICRPGLDRLASVLGKSARTVQAGLRELEEAGLIEVIDAGGGRGRRKGWRLVAEPAADDEQPSLFSGEPKVNKAPEKSDARDGTAAPLKGASRGAGAANSRVLTPSRGAPSGATAAPGSIPGAGRLPGIPGAVRVELSKWGVGEPVLSELARQDWCTVEVVRALGKSIRGPEQAGLLIHKLRQDGARVHAVMVRQEQEGRDVRERAERAAERIEAERRDVESERARVEDWWRSVGEAEGRRVLAEATASVPLLRDLYGRAESIAYAGKALAFAFSQREQKETLR